MEDRRFDQITRALTGQSGRRQVIKTIFGSGVAGALGAFGLAETEAKQGKKNSKVKERNKKASRDKTTCNSVAVCRRTGQGEVVKCVGNCGSASSSSDCVCGNSPEPCPDLTTCFSCSTPNDAASCQQCQAGQIFCNGACVDGDCCADSDCVTPGICQVGTGTCSNNTCTYDEAPDLTSCTPPDAGTNRKGKGKGKKAHAQVAPTGVCCSGDCFAGDCCADTDCSTDEICSDHQCVPNTQCQNNDDCGTDQVCCSGACFTGVCCTADDCATSGSASAKRKHAKAQGLEVVEDCCDNQCVDTDSDPNNCGGCGQQCSEGETCSGGKCTSTCAGIDHPCVGEGNVCCEGLICGPSPNPGHDLRCCAPGTEGCVPICTPETCDATQCLVCDPDGLCVSKCPLGQQCDGNGNCVPVPCTPENCNPQNCLTCNASGQCVSTCSNGQTCNGQGQCTGGGGGCTAAICSPSMCLTCNASGQCVSLCPFGQTCAPTGICVTLPTGCQTDADCGVGGICLNGICFVTSTCPAGQSNLQCCRNAVKKACRHRGGLTNGNGHICRVKGKKRCKQNFGNT